MREIKFRAWNKNSKEMVNNPKVYDYSSEGESMWFNLNYGLEDEDFILMQYTGLKDKNGVEIYEGDIVNVEISHLLTPPNLGKAIVEFKDLSWRFSFLNPYDEEECYAKYWYSEHTEVIGNVYENKELLTKD